MQRNADARSCTPGTTKARSPMWLSSLVGHRFGTSEPESIPNGTNRSGWKVTGGSSCQLAYQPIHEFPIDSNRKRPNDTACASSLKSAYQGINYFEKLFGGGSSVRVVADSSGLVIQNDSISIRWRKE